MCRLVEPEEVSSPLRVASYLLIMFSRVYLPDPTFPVIASGPWFQFQAHVSEKGRGLVCGVS